MTAIEKQLKEFEEFMVGLSDLDHLSFTTFISLPSAMNVINNMEECEYKRMAVFALALKQIGGNK